MIVRLFLPAPERAHVSPGTLRPVGDFASTGGDTVGHTARRTIIGALVVLAAPLGAVHAFLGCIVAQWLREPALADLAADEVVNAVLEVVDLVDTGNLCFVELVCFVVGISFFLGGAISCTGYDLSRSCGPLVA